MSEFKALEEWICANVKIKEDNGIWGSLRDVNRCVRQCLRGELDVPVTIQYQETRELPVYTITVVKEECHRFTDKNGRTWVMEE
jgi:hypothetical protein